MLATSTTKQDIANNKLLKLVMGAADKKCCQKLKLNNSTSATATLKFSRLGDTVIVKNVGGVIELDFGKTVFIDIHPLR